jgi:hypothetical protein
VGDSVAAGGPGGMIERRQAAPRCKAPGQVRYVPYEVGHALLGQGRCLVALGRAPEAAAPLAAAREIFARLGARPALADTDDWLVRAAAR